MQKEDGGMTEIVVKDATYEGRTMAVVKSFIYPKMRTCCGTRHLKRKVQFQPMFTVTCSGFPWFPSAAFVIYWILRIVFTFEIG